MAPDSRSQPTRRSLLRGAAACCALALAGCRSAPPASLGRQRLQLLGEARLPHRHPFRGTVVGGLSGLDFDPVTGLWVAISDDRSDPARFYTLDLAIDRLGLKVELRDVVALRQADGRTHPGGAGGEPVDPEALRLLPAGAGLLWTSEGDGRARRSPTLRHARLDGSHVRDFAVPELLRFAGVEGMGPRNNQTLEGLALTPDGATAWAAMEGPLLQDGPAPTVAATGGPCRFTAFDVASGRALRQLAYVPDPLPNAPLVPGGYADNGVSEILMLDAHRMLVLERGYSAGAGVSLRLYEIDTREGSDVLAAARLEPGAFRPVAKRPVADFAQLGLSRVDNTEGMAWGPRRPDGGRTLVVVSDDNFNPLQVTQFAAFDYLE